MCICVSNSNSKSIYEQSSKYPKCTIVRAYLITVFLFYGVLLRFYVAVWCGSRITTRFWCCCDAVSYLLSWLCTYFVVVFMLRLLLLPPPLFSLAFRIMFCTVNTKPNQNICAYRIHFKVFLYSHTHLHTNTRASLDFFT